MKKQIHWAEPKIEEEEIEAVTEAVKSTWIGGNGPLVKQFEKELSSLLGVKYAIAVNNGTSALLCAMQALREAKYPMRFLVPTLTFFATGATVHEMSEKGLSYLIDCDRKTFNILTDLSFYRGVPIVVPVDVGGLPVDYDELRKNEKIMLADSAEALGSKYKGEYVGKQADIHTFSFHSAKVITTGEGGAITTNNKELYEIMKSIANQGYGKKEWYEYRHERIGFNYRMPELQAALGLVQLKKLDRFVRERNEKAKTYKDILGDLVEYQYVPKWATHNYFLFIILVKNNVKLCQELRKEGIETKTMWIPLHKQPPFDRNAHLENAEEVANHGLTLPIHNNLSEEDVKEIAQVVRRLVKNE